MNNVQKMSFVLCGSNCVKSKALNMYSYLYCMQAVFI